MHTYRVQLNTDAAWAEAEVRASSLEEAFDLARALDPDDLHFAPFTEPLPVNHIIVMDVDGCEHAWWDDALLVRLAAEDLYVASKNLLTALKDRLLAEGADRVTLSCLRHLKAAIDRADGRAQ